MQDHQLDTIAVGNVNEHRLNQDQDHDQKDESATTTLIPWKYCNPYANNRSPERLFLFQGESVIIQQRLDEKVTIDQNTGNVVWDGAYLMSKYIESNIRTLKDKSCLELGAGTGLVSIVAWLSGSNNVLATDLPGPHTEHVEKNVRSNSLRIEKIRRDAIAKAAEQTRTSSGIEQRLAARNALVELVSNDLHVAPLDWESPTFPESTPFQGPFSFIFCSEILYLPQFHRALLKTITRFSDESTVVILLWKQRGLGEERFFALAARPSTGWRIEQLDRNVLDSEFQDQPYGIARMTRVSV